MVDGPAAGHAITFLTSARGMLDAVRGGPVYAQAKDVMELLGDPERCQVVLVTLPETTPVNEVIETTATLVDRVGVRLGPVVINEVDANVRAGSDDDDARPRRDAGRSRGCRVPTCETGDAGRRDREARTVGHCARDRAGVATGGRPRRRTHRDAGGLTLGGHAVKTLDTPLRGATVVVCCGSGGVGKTTTAAVIGIELAPGAVERVVVVTIDPARRLADALGLSDGLGPEPQRIDMDLPGELWGMMLDTAVMFDRVVRANAADAEQADRIVQNRFFRNMVGALSGTQEYMASEALHQLHGDERFDVVIVDTPPSRHALDFLEAPGVLARFLEHKVFKLLMPTRGGLRVLNTAAQPLLRAIGRVVGSDVLVDAVAFFQAFAGMEVGFRDRASSVMSLLISPQTRYVLVAAPRQDTVAEAVWFAEQLRTRDRGGGGGRQPGSSAVRVGIGGRGGGARWLRMIRTWRPCGRTSPSCAPSPKPNAMRSPRSTSASRVHHSSRCRSSPATSTTSTASPRSAAICSSGNVDGVHILLATDVDWIVDDITAALGGPDTSFTVCREGRVVVGVVAEREPDLAILDMQIGSKGGMAVTMAMRLDESAGMLPHVPVIMLLDRRADVFLARRSGADGWLIKPLDPLRIKRAVAAVLAGGTYVEGVSVPTSSVPEVEVEQAEVAEVAANP